MDLDIRVVRYFVAVVDAGTYTAAAQRLHIATPSVSQQIRALERRLGVRLLDRDHRGARPTDAGRAFLTHARGLLASQEQALAVVERHRRAQCRAIRLGYLTGMAGRHTRKLLEAFRREAGDVTVDLVQLPWAEQVAAVLNGRVDAALVRAPLPDAEVRTGRLLTEPRVLVMSAGHVLADRTDLRVADLRDVVQVDTDGVDDRWRRFWTLDPRPDGSRPRYGPLVHTVEEMLEVCAATDTVGITAQSVVELYPRPDLVHRPIVDIAPTSVELVLPSEPGAPLVELFADVARRAAPLTG